MLAVEQRVSKSVLGETLRLFFVLALGAGADEGTSASAV